MTHVKKSVQLSRKSLVTSHALDTLFLALRFLAGQARMISLRFRGGADLFMTGDIKHHTALDMEAAGIASGGHEPFCGTRL